MGEIIGVLAAVLSSGLGGAAVGATRYIADALDPLTIGSLRFGIGFLLLLPFSLFRSRRWPDRSDWIGVAGLGVLFFCVFPVLFNASLVFTTAARGALALSTLPLLTLLVGAALGQEALTGRKALGVSIAVSGVAIALISGLATAPDGAWIGDCLMVAAALCMAFYNVWSRPFIRRSGPIPFTIAAMGVGTVCMIAISYFWGGFEGIGGLTAKQWSAIAYLGLFGGALVFYLWAFALSRTTPTRVAISVTVNPISASIFGAVVLQEPIGWNVIVGLVAVAAGIWLAATEVSYAGRCT